MLVASHDVRVTILGQLVDYDIMVNSPNQNTGLRRPLLRAESHSSFPVTTGYSKRTYMPRSPYPPPRHADGGLEVTSHPKRITFLHPGYPRDAQPLLILPACNQDNTIDHEVARIACAVVACNEFEGFFTTDVRGERRVYGSQLPFTEEGYFFQVPGRDGMV